MDHALCDHIHLRTCDLQGLCGLCSLLKDEKPCCGHPRLHHISYISVGRSNTAVMSEMHLGSAAVSAKVAARAAAEAHDAVPAAAAAGGTGIVCCAKAIPGAAVIALQHMCKCQPAARRLQHCTLPTIKSGLLPVTIHGQVIVACTRCEVNTPPTPRPGKQTHCGYSDGAVVFDGCAKLLSASGELALLLAMSGARSGAGATSASLSSYQPRGALCHSMQAPAWLQLPGHSCTKGT